jgi:hypothetical protein
MRSIGLGLKVRALVLAPFAASLATLVGIAGTPPPRPRRSTAETEDLSSTRRDAFLRRGG